METVPPIHTQNSVIYLNNTESGSHKTRKTNNSSRHFHQILWKGKTETSSFNTSTIFFTENSLSFCLFQETSQWVIGKQLLALFQHQVSIQTHLYPLYGLWTGTTWFRNERVKCLARGRFYTEWVSYPRLLGCHLISNVTVSQWTVLFMTCWHLQLNLY